MQQIGQVGNQEQTDEALVKAFQAGNTEVFPALVARYLTLIRRKACSFREIFSLEREDLYQEGLLGLFDAANTYAADGRASFETYAGRCISNRIVSAVRRSASRKNSFLNHAVPIEAVADLGAGQATDPQALLENRDELDGILQKAHVSLSPFERRALSLYLGGWRRAEIERALGIPARAFDNARARVRKKLRRK